MDVTVRLSKPTYDALLSSAHCYGWNVDNVMQWLVHHWIIDVMPHNLTSYRRRSVERELAYMEATTMTPPMRLHVQHELALLPPGELDPRD